MIMAQYLEHRAILAATEEATSHSSHKSNHKTAKMENQQNQLNKQYVAAVDKALKAFEYTTEWADLIAALGKLIKVSSAQW